MKTTCECGHEIEYTREDIKGTVHYVLCGDATVITHVERLMAGQKADMVFTDPPYGMDLDTDWTGVKGSKKTAGWIKKLNGGNKYAKVIGDDKDFNFSDFLWIDAKEQFWFGADYYSKQLPGGGSWFVWDKRLTESADLMIGSAFEMLWSKQKHKRDIIRIKWAGIYGLAPEDTKARVHPTQKPTSLFSWIMERYSKTGDIVLDPFLGSVSTLIACEKLGRRCYGMEIDPHYCDVVINRWQNFTGKKAVKC